jgi:hypothetical protein
MVQTRRRREAARKRREKIEKLAKKQAKQQARPKSGADADSSITHAT